MFQATVVLVVYRLAITTLFVGVVAAQASPYDRALAAFSRGDATAALALLDASDAGLERVDSLLLRARILVANGRIEQARAVADQARELHAQRQEAVARDIERLLATAESSGAAAGGSAGGAAAASVREVLVELGPLRPRARGGAEPDQRWGELVAQLVEILQRLPAASRGDETLAVLATLVRNEQMDPRTRTDVIVAVARASEGEVAAAWRRAMQQLLRQAFAASGTKAVVAARGAKGAVAGEAAGRPAEDPAGSVGADDMTILVSAFHETGAHGDVVDAFAATVDSGLYAPTAKTLRLMASTLNRWASVLEGMAADNARKRAEVAKFLGLCDQLATNDATRGIAEDALQPVRRWAGDPAAAAASERLARAADRHLAEAERREGRGDWLAAAGLYERASQCDPAHLDALPRAAAMFEKAKAIAESARVLRILVSRADAATAAAAQGELERLWDAARARLAEFDRAAAELPRDPAAAVQARLALVERLLPVLDGPRLAAIRDLLTDNSDKVAMEQLEGLIKELRDGRSARAERLGDATELRVGSDLLLPAYRMKLEWVPGNEGVSPLWRSGLVSVATWQAAMPRSESTAGADRHGGVVASRDRAAAFCLYLTKKLTEVGTLSAEHELALPSINELQRLQAGGKLPTARDVWLWTRDNTDGRDFHARKRPIGKVWRATASAERSVWQPQPDVALFVVLRRRDIAPSK